MFIKGMCEVVTLKLLSSGRSSPSLVHRTVGSGYPVVPQLRVTLNPPGITAPAGGVTIWAGVSGGAFSSSNMKTE